MHKVFHLNVFLMSDISVMISVDINFNDSDRGSGYTVQATLLVVYRKDLSGQ